MSPTLEPLPGSDASALLAVADALVLKALEKVGSRLLRQVRSRHNELRGRPVHLAYRIWQTDDETIDKALKGAWDVVPYVLEGQGLGEVLTERLVSTLDDYVHDLVVTGEPHTLEELTYRLTDRLELSPGGHR